ERVLKEHGRVDILVNNAGRSIRRSVNQSLDRFHDYERTMQLNYFGAVKLMLAAIAGMKERGSGHIINISSIGVQAYQPRLGAYHGLADSMPKDGEQPTPKKKPEDEESSVEQAAHAYLMRGVHF